MSNHLAIATVTATLFNLLDTGKENAGTTVTTKPPDKAREKVNGNQVNIFLYHSVINATLRSMEPRQQVKPGESGHPSLALKLYYLVTAYGNGDDEVAAHRVLGRAMSNLHDHPILGREEFRGANADLAASDLHEQVERVRITPEPMSLDDMFKLWSSFQTQYRPSVAYQVSVVLIDSQRPARTPLPVLTRSEEDRGIGAQADLVPPFPTIEAVSLPRGQRAAQLGDRVTLTGHHLDGDSIDLYFRHPRATAPIVLQPVAGTTSTDSEVIVELTSPPPAGGADWIAGIYSLSAVIHTAGEDDRTTNEVALALAPKITSIAPNPADRAADSTLTVGCSPAVLPEQHASLLLGDQQILSTAAAAATDSLEFTLAATRPGEHCARLRVDGIDSLLIDHTKTPPVFDPTQKVTLT